ARMQSDVADLPRRWREEFEPELARDLAAWQAFHLQAASWDELVQHFDQMLERMVRHWEIHFLIVFPVLHSTRVLSRMYEHLAGARREPEAEMQAVAAEREQLTAATLAQIAESERAAFEQALRVAQRAAPLRETHAFFIDQASVAYFRYTVVELAKRLTQKGV